MAQQDAKSKIVMVSFVAELCGLWDLLRLAECLRHELIRYDISVHCYFAGTIITPGYEEEEAAKTLYKGNFIISDIIGDAIRASTLGVSLSNNAFFDAILCALLGLMVTKPVRWYFDKMVHDSKADKIN
ncbi:NADP-binding protein [Gigaspora margarita]|uniref:NADP-binding protein n=1 Tax=Gigaspora margarita TaxID=4874 RepID=A0A8H3XEL3_GIGMA|nr:NADP-binding protein [Gigaspora margarita]